MFEGEASGRKLGHWDSRPFLSLFAFQLSEMNRFVPCIPHHDVPCRQKATEASDHRVKPMNLRAKRKPPCS